jgi:MFS family permease
MSTRTASWLAWPLAALGVTLYVLSIPMFLLARSANVPSGWGVDLPLGNLLAGASFLIFPLVGAMIASRRPRNPIGWLCLAIGLLWAFSGLLDYYKVYGMARPGSLPFPLAMAWVNNWLWVPSVGLLGTYVFLLFPDGRLPSKRWRPMAWLCGAVIGFVSVGFAFGPGPLEGLGGVQNPIVLLRPWMMPVFWVSLPLLPLCMLASALSLVLRYRHSGGEERQQIKWLAFAALIVGATYLSVLVAGIFFVPTLVSGGDKTPVWYSLLLGFMLMSFAGVPIAIGFAVLKYRLYDIDIVINRTLVYGSLTATLVTVYLGGVAVLQRLFVALTGEKSTLAVVASTLVIAALFTPLRHRIQGFIDRRFYRKKYDARKTLEAFSAKLRDETDLEALSDDLVGIVRETMQPAHASLWLRTDRETAGGRGG